MIERVVYTKIAAADTTASTRVYPEGRVPQDADLPYVSFFCVDQEWIPDFSNVSDLRKARVQVDCWASTYDAARTLAREVEAALTLTSAETIATVLLKYMIPIDKRDTPQSPLAGQALGTIGVSTDFETMWKNPVGD